MVRLAGDVLLVKARAGARERGQTVSAAAQHVRFSQECDLPVRLIYVTIHRTCNSDYVDSLFMLELAGRYVVPMLWTSSTSQAFPIFDIFDLIQLTRASMPCLF